MLKKKIILGFILLGSILSVTYACANPNSLNISSIEEKSPVFIENSKLRINIDPLGCSISNVVLKEIKDPYSDTNEILLSNSSKNNNLSCLNIGYEAMENDGSNEVWQVIKSSANQIQLSTKRNDKNKHIILRTISLEPNSYKVLITDSISNLNGAVRQFVMLNGNGKGQQQFFINNNGKKAMYEDIFKTKSILSLFSRETANSIHKNKIEDQKDSYWGAIDNNKKLIIAIKNHCNNGFVNHIVNHKNSKVFSDFFVQNSTNQFEVIFGPNKVSFLKQYDINNVRDYGMFSFLVKWLCEGAELFMDYSGNSILSYMALLFIFFLLMLGFVIEEYKRKSKVQAVASRMNLGNSSPNAILMQTISQQLQGIVLSIIKIILFYIVIFHVLFKCYNFKLVHFLWIKDLSAPDPYSIFNFYGSLPLQVPKLLNIGVCSLYFFFWNLFLIQRKNQSQQMMMSPQNANKLSTMTVVSNIITTIFVNKSPFVLILSWFLYPALSMYFQYFLEKRLESKQYYQL